jgi:hypothetical protein
MTMLSLDFLLLLVAFVSFVLAAVGVASKVNLVALGLACWILSLLL